MIYLLAVIVIVVVVELLLRTAVKKYDKQKLESERTAILKESEKIDLSKVSNSLKRVELENPLSRILVVDKDEKILDKLRSMLVLDGYSVDTVNSGVEAVNLAKIHHYDFIISSEQTKDMTAQELTKVLNTERPDTDVIILVEGVANATPYDLIREGAIDFIQKPHIDSRLNDFVRTSLSKRRESIKEKLDKELFVEEKEVSPVLAPFSIPLGLFYSKNMLWIRPEQKGYVRIGINDLFNKLVDVIDTIDFPNPGMKVSKGQSLFVIKKDIHEIVVKSPISGTVYSSNFNIRQDLNVLKHDCYSQHWFCSIVPDNFKSEINEYFYGKEADNFFIDTISKLKNDLKLSEDISTDALLAEFLKLNPELRIRILSNMM